MCIITQRNFCSLFDKLGFYIFCQITHNFVSRFIPPPLAREGVKPKIYTPDLEIASSHRQGDLG